MSQKLQRARSRFFPEKAGDATTLTDYYLIACLNIEETLAMAGAVPGEDYSALDVMKLAAPFVQHAFAGGHLDLTVPSGTIDRNGKVAS